MNEYGGDRDGRSIFVRTGRCQTLTPPLYQMMTVADMNKTKR